MLLYSLISHKRKRLQHKANGRLQNGGRVSLTQYGRKLSPVMATKKHVESGSVKRASTPTPTRRTSIPSLRHTGCDFLHKLTILRSISWQEASPRGGFLA